MPTSTLRTLAALLLLAVLLLTPTWLSANTNGEAGVDALRLNVSPRGYPPYLIVDNDRVSGIVWDVINRISSQLEIPVETARIPRKRVDGMILSGYINATPRAIEWTDNPDHFLFTDTIVPVEEVFFHPVASEFVFNNIDDLKAKVFVTHLGYQYPYLDELFENGLAKRFDVADDLDLFRYLLDSQRFDAAISDRLVGQWLIRNHPQIGGYLTSTERSISNFGLRLMVRKDMGDFVECFNEALAELKTSGELDKILARYR
ncbi:substrate-binding periplasmic protein [Marinobacter zhejiangensis]|uniref:Amino acid ABC transporter substrate-binding protein, PAAT family (TC 3.A.1.3.-) n=1 Tax=Marinobacter zhejiangensis TaxID=488535 RepID=A0A1I4P007_9GAMM|nr:transporter substrate-binding domain-containing protein [Marinobacter zhejiangensis]SFM21025.1 amino acid ABC transporter substrate-binding protein, PAAT family (TC 3.A.1.3.-) [Marinobacter zhejiangensis]